MPLQNLESGATTSVQGGVGSDLVRGARSSEDPGGGGGGEGRAEAWRPQHRSRECAIAKRRSLCFRPRSGTAMWHKVKEDMGELENQGQPGWGH